MFWLLKLADWTLERWWLKLQRARWLQKMTPALALLRLLTPHHWHLSESQL
jgi:hypothetical protein